MPTISDVAKKAGVSPATVSRVIQGAENVRPATREKVERAIEELGYVPSAIAQGLRSKRTRSLALVVPDITNTFWTTVARGVEDEAQEHGYSVLLCNTDENLAKTIEQQRKEIAGLEELNLPKPIIEFISDLHRRNSRGSVGFRRRNMPALLLRFFRNMKVILTNCTEYMRPGAEAMIVVGDSYTVVGKKRRVIPTTDFIEAIGKSIGLRPIEHIPISVTTENLLHIRNAIKKNLVLRMRKT